MKKRVFIIHGWSGHPSEAWFPWLKKELETRGFEVHVPQMPDPDLPRIGNWVPAIEKAVGKPDEQTYFVGHSMGNQAIARYLEKLPNKVKVGGVVFVAGFFKRLTGLEEEELETRNHWIDTPIDLKKVKEHFEKSTAIFSDDDPYVPMDNQDEFKNILGSKIVIEKAKGHMGESSGIKNSPKILKELLEIAAEK